MADMETLKPMIFNTFHTYLICPKCGMPIGGDYNRAMGYALITHPKAPTCELSETRWKQPGQPVELERLP